MASHPSRKGSDGSEQLALLAGAAVAVSAFVYSACTIDHLGTGPEAVGAGGQTVSSTTGPGPTSSSASQGGGGTTVVSSSATGGMGGMGGEGGVGGEGGMGGMPTPVGEVSAGFDHSCARLAAGEVKCWGANFFGQLGNMSTSTSLVPADVHMLTQLASVSAGTHFACGAKDDGTLWCWGRDKFGGTLGNGSGEGADSNVPVESMLTGATRVSAAFGHACAATTQEVHCWGTNAYGQIGQMANVASSDAPAKVDGLPASDVVSLAAGNFHTCAAFANGELYCWGRNEQGQLGTGMTGTGKFPTPVKVTLPADAAEVAAGDMSTCARLVDGTVACWGRNNLGQLGNDSTADSPTPVLVSNVSGATAIACGNSHGCAVVGGGEIRCWGYNSDGQLGNGTTADSDTPVTVLGGDNMPLANAVRIDGGRLHTCAMLADGGIRCWGDGGSGQLGHNASTDSATAVTPQGL